MTSLNDLDINTKRSIILNAIALNEAIRVIALENNVPDQEVWQYFTDNATDDIDEMSDAEVEAAIATIQAGIEAQIAPFIKVYPNGNI